MGRIRLFRIYIIIGILVITFTYIFYFRQELPNFQPFISNSKPTPVDIFSENTNLAQDDPLILDYIRRNHLIPPSNDPYNINFKIHWLNQDAKLLLGIGSPLVRSHKRDRTGFFIECGANNGEFISNTIELELEHKWTGLLIESAPRLFRKLVETKRKAWKSDACLSGSKPEKIEFLRHKDNVTDWRQGNGKINPSGKYKPPYWQTQHEAFKREDYLSDGIVECFPLFSLLSAINVTLVDYFSLDVEGHEYKILDSIPFDKVKIKVIQVEHMLAPEGKDAIHSFLKSKGYNLMTETDGDFIFQLD